MTGRNFRPRRAWFAVLFSFWIVGVVLSATVPGRAAESLSFLYLPIILKDGSAGTIPPATRTPTLTLVPTITATSTGTATPTPEADTIVIVGNNFFDDADITIQLGDTVVWQREAGFHNVVADDGSFRLGEPPDGDPGVSWQTVSFTFTELGIVPYYCEAHGAAGGIGMSGTITVEAAE